MNMDATGGQQGDQKDQSGQPLGNAAFITIKVLMYAH
jgi:hypothetical protein